MNKSLAKDEKYTPLKYIESVKKVFGGEIDLDPFSCELANSRIKAKDFFSKEDDAFSKHWFGRVFANPPYSRGNLFLTISKAQYEFDMGNILEGILLVPNSTDAKWFQSLWKYPICFTDHRIKFVTYNKITKKFYLESNPENGSCFIYFGLGRLRFYSEFTKFGHVFGVD